MTKLQHSKDTGPEQDRHNKVANNYVKKPKILTSILGFICKAAEWYFQGFWQQWNSSYPNAHVNDAHFQICNTR